MCSVLPHLCLSGNQTSVLVFSHNSLPNNILFCLALLREIVSLTINRVILFPCVVAHVKVSSCQRCVSLYFERCVVRCSGPVVMRELDVPELHLKRKVVSEARESCFFK